MIDLQEKLRAHGHEIVAMVFDRAGERLAFASLPVPERRQEGTEEAPRKVRVWVARVRGQVISQEFELPSTFEESGPDWIWSAGFGSIALDFSPDGSLLAVAWELEELQGGEYGALAILDLKSGGVRRAEIVSPPGEVSFSPDGSLLALSSRGVPMGNPGVLWWTRVGGWKHNDGGRSVVGSRLAFSANGKRLVVVDDDDSSKTCGVTFVGVGSRTVAGRSRGISYLTWHGPLAVAPDGDAVVGLCTIQRRGSKRSNKQGGLWRWRPGATPERLMDLAASARELCWIDPEGRELLWVDEKGALLRQRVGHRRLKPIRPAPSLARLGGGCATVVNQDGTRIARERDGLVLVTRLRRKPSG